MPSQRQTVAREEAMQGTNILLLKEQAKKYAFIGNEANSISFESDFFFCIGIRKWKNSFKYGK